MEKIVVYFGCALTQASAEYREDMETFKDFLRQKFTNIKILNFVGIVNGTDRDVYRHDIHENVMSCDIMIAECTYPSIGLGWELGTAVELRKIPVLAIANRRLWEKVTRLVTGAENSEYNPNFHFEYYTNLMNTVPAIKKLIDDFIASHPEIK